MGAVAVKNSTAQQKERKKEKKSDLETSWNRI